MDIGCLFSKKNRVEVYAIGGKIFVLFIFWILDFKNRVFDDIAKHL
jgi:hypothetical protein